MEMKRSEHIQTVIDVVAVAQSQMADLSMTMSGISDLFAPEYTHVLEGFARILNELGYIRYIAERNEAEQATRQSKKPLQD